MEAFWGSPSENVKDRATAMLPKLMYERLEELGIDFCVVYPTTGLGFHRMPDPRLRRAICRAYNVFTADQFKGLGDRVIPAAKPTSWKRFKTVQFKSLSMQLRSGPNPARHTMVSRPPANTNAENRWHPSPPSTPRSTCGPARSWRRCYS